jgi:hypothetical protein
MTRCASRLGCCLLVGIALLAGSGPSEARCASLVASHEALERDWHRFESVLLGRLIERERVPEEPTNCELLEPGRDITPGCLEALERISGTPDSPWRARFAVERQYKGSLAEQTWIRVPESAKRGDRALVYAERIDGELRADGGCSDLVIGEGPDLERHLTLLQHLPGARRH